jgi:SAM-dependent methyltransferase
VAGLFPDVDLPRRSYDAVVAFDLLEHLADPLTATRAMRDHLEAGGILFLQTPCYRGEGAGWAMFSPGEHLFLFDDQNVRDLLRRAGLEVTALTRAIFSYDMFIVSRRIEDLTPLLRWSDRLKGALPHRRRTTRSERHAVRTKPP